MSACLLLPALTGPAAAAASSSSDWTVYHGDPIGTGVATGVASIRTSAPQWTSPALDGQLYGEPLVAGSNVYVATENDTIDALSAATGALVWSTHVATAVPASSLSCGDISPTVGITGTPVIDVSRDELFAVADEEEQGAPTHVLVGLDTTTGKVELSQVVDPPGSVPRDLLQRTGLALDDGRVVFGFGGNYGDCGDYRGWVVAVPEAGGSRPTFAVDGAAGQRQGAVWMGARRRSSTVRGTSGWSRATGRCTRRASPTTTAMEPSSSRPLSPCCSTSHRPPGPATTAPIATSRQPPCS